jgi:hypothetical protein
VAVRLVIEDLEGSTTVVDLGTEAVTIGRKPHNTIQLTEQNISRSHAKLIFQDDGWLIEDLHSFNGVKVNGVPIHEPTLVRATDLIQIGDYHLTLTDDVARATIDMGPGTAANDGARAMPGAGAAAHPGMAQAGASSELPSVSFEDLPRNSASGTAGAPTTVGGDEDKPSKVGLVIGLIGGVLAIAGLAIWLMNGDKSGDEKVADGKSDTPANDSKATGTPEPTTAAAVPAVESGTDTTTGEDTGAAMAGSETGETGLGADIVETDGGETDDGVEVVETDGGDEPSEVVETDGGDEPEPSKPASTKPKPKPKPTTPKLPPDEALAAARKASLTGNNRKAYSLAKDAYDQNKSSEALSVMGVAACKMSSESKAKSAYKKMSDSKDKQMLEKICKPLGIEL